ncbi:MAG: ABC exporter membrane fusion protein [Cyanobacteria bacterium]|nr:ABC exporter membrane fusion protein [Cyanobacteriota bacterium]MDW8199873.1 ABC exporter membrane fusion protein [Cyanobacteriota bacterium SKYGB_h_bin112]
MKSFGTVPIVVTLVGAVCVVWLTLVAVVRLNASKSKLPELTVASTAAHDANKSISALGRIEPGDGVVKVAAPSALGSSRVERLLVKEGEQVQAGQVLAVMDNRDRLQAQLVQAEAEVREAEARLAQVQAGAKQGEIDAQRATINRLEAQYQGEINAQEATVARLTAEVQNADLEYQRFQMLYETGATSASQRDSKRLALDTARQSLQEAQATLTRIRRTTPAALTEARATLNRIAEVRPTDIQQAEAAVGVAIANLQRVQAEFDTSVVRAPISGEVLKIHTDPGEVVGNDGILELGNTNLMYAVAEVYETDIGRVRLGQPATITSPAFAGTVTGVVDRIGKQIRKNDVLNTDPAADTDTRVVEVRIRLNETQAVKGLTNLQVMVLIESKG